MSDERALTDRALHERSFWSRRRLQVQLTVLMLVAWGPDIVNSIASYCFDYHKPPMLGSPRNIVGAYLLCAFETLTVAALAFAWVKPKKMGLFLPRDSRPPWQSWGKVFNLAFGVLLAVLLTRSLMIEIGLPHTVGAGEPSDPIGKLPWVLRSGLFEEIPMAAMVVLMLRAKWNPVNIALFIGILRVLFHLYQGISSVIPMMLFGAGFAYLFIKYRRVGPLIAAHTLHNTLWLALA